MFLTSGFAITPKLAPVCAGVSPGNKLSVGGAGADVCLDASSAASFSGARVASSGSAMIAYEDEDVDVRFKG